MRTKLVVGVRAVAILSVFPLLLAFLVSSSITSNGSIVKAPVSSSVNSTISTLFPQGWAFFTKPASSEMLRVYQTEGGVLTDLSLGVNSEPSNWFGLSRETRAQNLELPLILDGINADHWRDCEGLDLEACGNIDGEPIPVVNESITKTFCGSASVVAVVVTPWEWRHLESSEMLPTQVLKVNLKC